MVYLFWVSKVHKKPKHAAGPKLYGGFFVRFCFVGGGGFGFGFFCFLSAEKIRWGDLNAAIA